jgi:hypothetical protein
MAKFFNRRIKFQQVKSFKGEIKVGKFHQHSTSTFIADLSGTQRRMYKVKV